MSTIPEGIPLGPGPRPTTGAELAARMRAEALALIGGRLPTGLEQARLEAELDGPDIPRLDLDLTGLRLDLPEGEAAPADAAAPAPEASRTPGLLRAATLRADPAYVLDTPVALRGRLDRLPVVWVERADGTAELLWDRDADSETAGELTLSLPQSELPALARRVLETALAGEGVAVEDLDLALASAGPDAVALEATAVGRYGFLSAKVTLRAQARIVDGTRLLVEQADLRSRNPLVTGLLALTRSQLDGLVGREVDLARYLPAQFGDARAHLDVDADAVRLRAAVGP